MGTNPTQIKNLFYRYTSTDALKMQGSGYGKDIKIKAENVKTEAKMKFS